MLINLLKYAALIGSFLLLSCFPWAHYSVQYVSGPRELKAYTDKLTAQHTRFIVVKHDDDIYEIQYIDPLDR